jgi:hypothetical protein
VNKEVAQKIYEHDIDSCKKWLCDNTLKNVRQGLGYIISLNNPFGPFYQSQISHLKSKLIGNIMSAGSLRRERHKSSFEAEDDMQLSGMRLTVEDGTVSVDDIVTIDASNFEPDIFDHHIASRHKFVKLIYQYTSCFPNALYTAYKEVTGENLILDDLSEVREFYESCSTFDSWASHQLCAYISHCDPEALDFISENPKELLPTRLSRIFSRSDLYEKNLPLVKAAILGGAFELIHVDRDNWAQSSLKPKKGLEWAKKKGVCYHPMLDEFVLAFDATPAISSGYTTPYLEMMLEVIRELEISRENQGKKEAIAALFAKKLMDHKITPPSQKLADAMATLVRLPESQQGRAKRKG